MKSTKFASFLVSSSGAGETPLSSRKSRRLPAFAGMTEEANLNPMPSRAPVPWANGHHFCRLLQADKLVHEQNQTDIKLVVGIRLGSVPHGKTLA